MIFLFDITTDAGGSMLAWRMAAGFLTALCVLLLLGRNGVAFLARFQGAGQPERFFFTEEHQKKKAGTPTGGGLLMLAAILVAVLMWGRLSALHVWFPLGLGLAFGTIGLIDDCMKVFRQNADGLSRRLRLLLELALPAGCFILYAHFVSTGDLREVFTLRFPLLGSVYLGYAMAAVAALTVAGAANGVNITDGLDGLAALPLVACSLVMAVILAHSAMDPQLALQGVVEDPAVGEAAVLAAAMAGAALGFLWFNAQPARIFMGDVGALSFGGMLGVMAVMARQEILFILIGGLFVLEVLSVILQILSLKTTGRRLFLFSPIHHHFERKNMPESRIVTRFWIIALCCALAGLFAFFFLP